MLTMLFLFGISRSSRSLDRGRESSLAQGHWRGVQIPSGTTTETKYVIVQNIHK